MAEFTPEVEAKAVPTKDPALLLVEEIESKLAELRGILGGQTEEVEEEEIEPQTDEEVVAGIPPKPKAPGGSPFNF